MADLVMGAVPSIITKLYKLLKEEYKLQADVKERIRSLTDELESAQAALRKVAEVPWDQLDEQVQIWSRQVREASYDMEDVLDTFLVCVKSPDSTEQQKSLLKRLGKKITNLFTKSKARREISVNTTDIMSHLEEVTERCGRYKVGDIAVAMLDTASAIDPRLHAMYNKVQDCVGMAKSSGDLISKLQPLQRDGASNQKMKIVSVVGVGGLGKTTLAKAVFDEFKGDFDCGAFVPVGRKPDLKKVLKDILMDLDEERRLQLSVAVFDERQLINDLRLFLKNKRYFLVIDDVWEVPSWEQIKLAIDDYNNYGARIVLTTRKQEVAKKADEIYNLQPLPDDSSRELFFIRIAGHEGKLDDNMPDEVIVKFLKKCAGVPLAIITMASLLAGKPRDRWEELYRSIGFGSEDNDQAKNTMMIVSFSYYDLPAHLRTCLLYLSAFPEDSIIPKDSLVWMWVAEGFVMKKQGMRLFESGEGYIHDLINRSMLVAVKSDNDDSIVTGCRVHDMVIDFIRSMSHQENFFSIVLGNDPGPLLESNNVPRRLAQHNRTMGHGHPLGDDLEMAKVRSMFAIGCGIVASDPFHGFTLLRVLVIDNCKPSEGSSIVRLEHVRFLLHLRLLCIRGTYVHRIPEGIGHLLFLQTLDLEYSTLEESPSPGSLPEQLVSLSLPTVTTHDALALLTRLTSLEELSILHLTPEQASWPLPTELRVLRLSFWAIPGSTVEMGSWEFVCHHSMLEHLTISCFPEVYVTDLDLPRLTSLRHLAVGDGMAFWKLPSCVNVWCLPNLSHLELTLEHLDEHDLKMLGSLPELRFLGLKVSKGASVVVVTEKDAALVYFPKLRCFELRRAMVSFHADEEDKCISLHVWTGGHDTYIGKPSISKDKLQSSSISSSTGGGGTSAGSATGGGRRPRDHFMPCLQVLRLGLVPIDGCYDDLGFEYGLPSLREMRVSTLFSEKMELEHIPTVYMENEKITAALRSAAGAHPNRPTFRAGSWWY